MQKQMRYIVIFLGVLVACAAYAVTKVNNVEKYTISREQPVVTIRMPSNPTTGYTWLIKYYDDTLLDLQSHQYTPAQAKPGMVGVGGTDTWVFSATEKALKAPIITKIILVYARPWEMKSQQDLDGCEEHTFFVVTH